MCIRDSCNRVRYPLFVYRPCGFTGCPLCPSPLLIDCSRCLSKVRFTLKHVVNLLVTYRRGQLRLKPHAWSVTHTLCYNSKYLQTIDFIKVVHKMCNGTDLYARENNSIQFQFESSQYSPVRCPIVTYMLWLSLIHI